MSYAEVQPDFAEGNGISAQGKVNVVNDTLGSPHVPGLKSIAPCRGSTSRIGATPPRHTRAQIRMQPDFAESNVSANRMQSEASLLA